MKLLPTKSHKPSDTKEKRAEYGERILYAVSAQLVREFGTGFAEKNLRRMVQFAQAFPEEQIVVTLSRQLGWAPSLLTSVGLAQEDARSW